MSKLFNSAQREAFLRVNPSNPLLKMIPDCSHSDEAFFNWTRSDVYQKLTAIEQPIPKYLHPSLIKNYRKLQEKRKEALRPENAYYNGVMKFPMWRTLVRCVWASTFLTSFPILYHIFKIVIEN